VTDDAGDRERGRGEAARSPERPTREIRPHRILSLFSLRPTEHRRSPAKSERRTRGRRRNPAGPSPTPRRRNVRTRTVEATSAHGRGAATDARVRRRPPPDQEGTVTEELSKEEPKAERRRHRRIDFEPPSARRRSKEAPTPTAIRPGGAGVRKKTRRKLHPRGTGARAAKAPSQPTGTTRGEAKTHKHRTLQFTRARRPRFRASGRPRPKKRPPSQLFPIRPSPMNRQRLPLANPQSPSATPSARRRPTPSATRRRPLMIRRRHRLSRRRPAIPVPSRRPSNPRRIRRTALRRISRRRATRPSRPPPRTIRAPIASRRSGTACPTA
jgi:hypothetical protein